MKKSFMLLCYIIIIQITQIEYSRAQLPSFILKSDTSDITLLELDEVSVSSYRESYKLRDLPASVSLIPGARVAEGEIQSIKDLTSLVPNFFMPEYGSKLTSPVYIRGIGSRLDTPSAGLYVDNVPYFDKSAFDFDLFDIESIEVLRGPQGTLYGRNTIGGLVNIHTRSPMHFQGSRIGVSAGNYGYLAGNISHYNKPNETTAFSLTGNYMHRDGYHINEYYNDPVDALNSYSARLRVVKMLTEKIKAEASAGFEKLDQGGYPYALFIDSIGKSKAVNYNDVSSFKRDMLSGAVTLSYGADNLDVNYTAGYQYFNGFQAIDQDFTQANLFFATQDHTQHLVSQELIVKSDNSNYKWTNGLFWFSQALYKEVNVDHKDDAVALLKLPAPMILQMEHTNPTMGGALFHQSALDRLFIDNLSLTAGLRVDYEEAKLDYIQNRIISESSTPMSEFNSQMTFFEFLPKVAMKYSLKPGKWTYLSVARGYKSGGFNTSFEKEEDRSYLPEYTWNYEAGFKMRWSGTLFTEFSLFYIDWRNQQVYQPVPSGRGQMLKNAGHSFSQGAEFSLRSVLFRDVNLNFDYGFTDARFISYKENAGINYDGNRIPIVPLHTLNLGLSRRFDLNDAWPDDITVRLNYRYTGKHYWREDNIHFQDGYGLLSSRVTINKGIVSLDLWARNILGKDYHAFYFAVPQLRNAYVQKGIPFTFGTNLSLNF